MVSLSPHFDPPVLKGIKVHPDNPFRFDFILDQGDLNGKGTGPMRSWGQSPSELKQESAKLIKYFLAGLTIPENDLWVNLSPYEKDRIIPPGFGLTEMGRDLLAEDYMLKQITASLIYPDDDTGKRFWKRVYQLAAERFGTTNIPINTFNKVWIVPDKAVVYENAKAGTAYVVEAKLKVMLEQDYLSLQKHAGQPNKPLNVNQLGSQIIREIVLPELTREVNYDKNFAQLRQIYNSLILAAWYKKKIRDSILAQVYEDKNKIAGLSGGRLAPDQIYQMYLKAFKKGAYNFIQEEVDPLTQQTIPRKYFSGGCNLIMDHAMTISHDAATVSKDKNLDQVVSAGIQPDNEFIVRPHLRLGLPQAERIAEEFLAELPRENPLWQMVSREEQDVLSVLRNLFIELSELRRGQHLTGAPEHTFAIFFDNGPLTLERLSEPSMQEIISKISLRRLALNAERPDIYGLKNLKEVFKNKRVLVTGGTGYVSAAIIKALLEVGTEKVVVYSRNPEERREWLSLNRGALRLSPVVFERGGLNRRQLARAMDKNRVNLVFHPAGETLVGKSMREPGKFFYTNVIGTIKLLQAMKMAGVRDVVFPSTTRVYSGSQLEERVNEEKRPNPLDPYAASKRLVEELLKEWEKNGIRSVILRTGPVAGAFYSKKTGMMYGDPIGGRLFDQLVKYYLFPNEVKFAIMGDWYPTPDGTAVGGYIDPESMANAYLQAAAHLSAGGRTLLLNVGTQEGVSVKQIVKLFEEILKEREKDKTKREAIHINPPVVAARPGEPAYSLPNTRRVNLELGWKSDKTPKEMLSSILDFYLWQEKYGIGTKNTPSNINPSGFLDKEAKFMDDIFNELEGTAFKENGPGRGVVSKELQFAVLFRLFISTLNPNYPIERSDLEKQLYEKALEIQATPGELINTMTEDFMTTLNNYQLTIVHRNEYIYKQRRRYIDKITGLYYAAQKEFEFEGYEIKIKIPARTVNNIVESLGVRDEYSAELLNESVARLIKFRTDDEASLRIQGKIMLKVIKGLAQLRQFKRDSVNRPLEWDFLVPVYASSDAEKPRAFKWYRAASRDGDWVKVSDVVVFNEEGKLLLREKTRNDGGVEWDILSSDIQEAGLSDKEAAIEGAERKGYIFAPEQLARIPQRFSYIFGPIYQEGLDKDKYIYYARRPSGLGWHGRGHETHDVFTSRLNMDQERAWFKRIQDHPELGRIVAVSPIQLIKAYTKHGESGHPELSDDLKALLIYPEFQQLIKAGGRAALSYSKFQRWLGSKDTDQAQSSTFKKGGIDLQPTFDVLQTVQGHVGIAFHLDPAQLQTLNSSSGFIPVIFSIQPLADLRSFLGVPSAG